jgi:hypothetical protein
VSFGLADHSFSTRFSLEGRGAKLECDTIFDDLTPLSSCDGDERHNVEYVSPYTYFSPDYGPRRSGRCALLVLLLFKTNFVDKGGGYALFPCSCPKCLAYRAGSCTLATSLILTP